MDPNKADKADRLFDIALITIFGLVILWQRYQLNDLHIALETCRKMWVLP